MAKAGRKTLLTHELRTKIVTLVAGGAYAYVAAQAVGVHKATYFRWLEWGEAGREPYKGFRAAVMQAHAAFRAAKEVEVAKVDPKFWLTHVARDKPGEPGWSERTELTGPDGGPIQLDDPYELLIRRLERIERGRKAAAARGTRP